MTDPISPEPIIEPDLPIVDSHQHLWFRPASAIAHVGSEENFTARLLAPAFRKHARYLFDEYLADISSGHNVRASVYVEASSMYRASGPVELQSLGEVEFANGMGAIAAAGVFTDIQICAAIVSSVDLRLGDGARAILERHMQAGGERYRGIRGQAVIWDADPIVLGPSFSGVPQLLLDDTFRQGFRHLAPLGLSYDAWQTEYQLPELVDLARAFPDTQIVVNHAGGLFGVGPYEGRVEDRFAAWRGNMHALAACPNVAVKLGGLGMPMNALPWTRKMPAASEELARDWRPYFETCIEAFGADRCMFESNFPVDAGAGSYAVIWNAFKRIAGGASAEERTALFSGTAARIYRVRL